jgi:hypothetical protein
MTTINVPNGRTDLAFDSFVDIETTPPSSIIREGDGTVSLVFPITLSAAQENAVYARAAGTGNKETILARALTALENNLAYIALDPPTNAQAIAQIEALTRQVNGIIRLVLNKLESAD